MLWKKPQQQQQENLGEISNNKLPSFDLKRIKEQYLKHFK